MSPAAPDPDPREPLTEEEHADRLQAFIDRHANQLAEHFSSVQILATNLVADGKTYRFEAGSGDMYARRGVVRAWTKRQEAR